MSKGKNVMTFTDDQALVHFNIARVPGSRRVALWLRDDGGETIHMSPEVATLMGKFLIMLAEEES